MLRRARAGRLAPCHSPRSCAGATATPPSCARPIRLTLLHGAEVVPGRVLGSDSGRTTRGHRFMSRGDLSIATADAYEPTLLAEGKVIPNFAERRADIERQLPPRPRSRVRC